jgi:hypothetical protein
MRAGADGTTRAAVSGAAAYALALGFDIAAQLALFLYLSRVLAPVPLATARAWLLGRSTDSAAR